MTNREDNFAPGRLQNIMVDAPNTLLALLYIAHSHHELRNLKYLATEA